MKGRDENKGKRVEKYFQQDRWFHGTTLTSFKNICKSKVIFDYNRGTELDFGFGFYMTSKEEQAKNYIQRVMLYLDEEDNEPVVIEFELNLFNLISNHRYKTFLHHDVEFSEFVYECRSNPEELIHDDEFIVGVMTDLNLIDLLTKYRNGIVTKEELIIGFRQWCSMEQLSLHTQKLCDILVMKKATFVTSGKELNIDEYNTNTKESKRYYP